MTTAFNRRAADPAAFAAYVQRRLGHPPAVVEKLLQMASAVGQGGTLKPADIATLKAAHPGVDAAFVEKMAAAVNAAPVASRQGVFVGALAGDPAAASGNLAAMAPATREALGLAESYALHSVVDGINAKRGGTDTKADDTPKADPMSARALLQAGFAANAPAVTRATLADKFSGAVETLAASREGAPVSLRDAVAASMDSKVYQHHAENVLAEDAVERDFDMAERAALYQPQEQASV